MSARPSSEEAYRIRGQEAFGAGHLPVAQGRLARNLLVAGMAIVLLALFARGMSEPIRHDEQISSAVGSLIGRLGLYQDISYAHLPNLPILLKAFLVFTGDQYQFLVGRIVVFLCWCTFLYAFTNLAWRLSGNTHATVLSFILIVTHPLFVDYKSVIIAAHLFPLCFGMLGFLSFMKAIGGVRLNPRHAFLCGLFLSIAVGFKANYIILIPPFVIAALVVPTASSLRHRLSEVALPMGIGGLIGGIPTFYYLAMHRDVFLFDVLEYFLGPQRIYWSDPTNIADARGSTLVERMVFGFQLWTSGVALLVAVAILYCIVLALSSSQPKTRLKGLMSWPAWLCLALLTSGIVVSFVPAPSFPQYFMPPVPFAILLAACLFGGLAPEQQPQAGPVLLAIGLAGLAAGGPALFQDLPKLLRPGGWEGVRIHQTADRIRATLDRSGRPPLIATLSPVYAVEAGADVYPELASGAFYYRIGDYLTAEQRATYRITSPGTIASLLARRPPDAILIGHEGVLDAPLERFALAHGYVRATHFVGRDRSGETVMYVRRAPQ